MKLVIDREILSNGLSIVSKAMVKNSPLPMLSNVLFECGPSGLRLTSTDLSTTISTTINVIEADKFDAAIPLGILMKLAGKLKGDNLTLDYDEVGFTLSIKSEKSKNNIKCHNPVDFPKKDFVRLPNESIKISSEQLLLVADKIAPSVSTQSHQQILQGIYIECTDIDLSFTATDSFRLSTIKFDNMGDSGRSGFNIIVPTESLVAFSTLFGDNPISMVGGKTEVMFSGGPTVAILSTINGNYPTVKKWAIEQSTKVDAQQIEPNIEEMSYACEMAAIFAKQSDNVLLLELGNMFSTVSAISKEAGDSSNTFVAPVASPLSIKLNATYLTEILGMFSEDDKLKMRVSGGDQAVIFLVDEINYVHAMFPIL